jgi:site-specific recombinase XerD
VPQSHWHVSATVSAGIVKPFSPNILRRSFAKHHLPSNQHIRTPQELLRLDDVSTNAAYAHVLHGDGQGSAALLDRM